MSEGMEVQEVYDSIEAPLGAAEQITESSSKLNTVGDLNRRIQEAFSRLDVPYTNLGENIDVKRALEERDRLSVEAKIQNLLLVKIIAATLNRLEKRGVYKEASEIDIRKVNLLITEEVVDILTGSSISLGETIVLLNKVATTGWIYPDLKEEQRGLTREENGFRLSGVKIGDYQAPAPQDIPDLIKVFTEKLDKMISDPSNHNEWGATYIAAWAYLVFLSIHPFADGNGRTARALSELVMIKMGEKDPITPGIDSRLSGTSDDPVEARAQIKAGLILPRKEGVSYNEVIRKRLTDYIINAPERYDQSSSDSISDYPGVDDVVILFSGQERSRRNQRFKSDFSNPIIESSMSYMRRALDVSKEVVVV